MKTLKYFFLGVIATILLVSIAVAVSYAFLKLADDSNVSSEETRALATPKHPVTSPSGTYQLQVVEGYDGLVHFHRFNIAKFGAKESSPLVVYSSTDTFRTRDTNFFFWDEKDRVWVYSGDVGTSYWVRVTDANWQKHDHKPGEPVPALLRKLRPEFFK